jgi:hypothetical protein
MNSKEFQNIFLVNETDQDILKAQYVLASSRIRRRGEKYDNIISGMNILYPDVSVLSNITDDDIREEYFRQLDKSLPFIATLIKGSIEEGYNIIFMCSYQERKLKHLKYFSEYVLMEFDYPIYDYRLYAEGISELYKYNKNKVLKKCNKILKRSKEIGLSKILDTKISSKFDEKKIKMSLKSYKKEDLIKIAKENGYYDDGMSKKELIETIIDFM